MYGTARSQFDPWVLRCGYIARKLGPAGAAAYLSMCVHRPTSFTVAKSKV